MKQNIPIMGAVMALMAPSAASAQTAQRQRPNLLIIMTDQYRGNALGCLGKEPVRTPHLDALAATGVCFSNAISNYPVSSPSRAMLMTGMYPLNNKVTANCNSANTPYGVELPQSVICWSDVLKAQGYHTGYIGKWHLDAPYKPYIPVSNNRGKVAWNEWCKPERRHGFDYWLSYGTYDRHLRPMYWSTNAPRDSFFYVNQWGPEYEADRALEFFARQQGSEQPFALVVSMNPPHTGYEQVPDRYKKMYADLDVESYCNSRPDIPAKGTRMGDHYRNNVRNYYACITGVDEQVGRILEGLQRAGLADNTIVVFTSDHGNCLGIHNQVTKNNYYEDSMRIPLIISWPGHLASRMDSRLQISIADLYPTLLSMMGMGSLIPDEVETHDLSKQVMSGKGKSPDQPYYRIEPNDLTTGLRGLRTATYTYVVEAKNGKVSQEILFDRQHDPYEMRNIAAEQHQVAQKLRKQLKAWLQQTHDPFATCL